MLEVLYVVAGLITGGTVALKFIAPKTKTTKDDEVLKVLEKIPVQTILEFLTKKGVVVPRDKVRDHRS